jgi:hypothetical protein
MTSAAAKGKMAQAALQILVQRESRAIAAAAAGIQEEVTGRLSGMFGLENSEWSQDDLYNYTFLRDWIGVRQLQEHLPEIKESFQEQYFAITEWRNDVKKYKAVMDLEPDDENQAHEVDSQMLMLFTFSAAVVAAEDSLHQMLAY